MATSPLAQALKLSYIDRFHEIAGPMLFFSHRPCRQVMAGLIFLLALPMVHAGGPLIACGCYTMCSTAVIAEAYSTGGLAVLSLPAQLLGCAQACELALACLSEDSHILVKSNESNVLEKQVRVGEVFEGQLVATLKDGRKAWTHVTSSRRYEGNFEGVEVVATDSMSNYSLTVTKEHKLVRLLRARSLLDEAWEVVPADALRRGDSIQVLGNDGARIANVTSVTQVHMQSKFDIKTESGTVLASNALITTMCDGELQPQEQSNFSLAQTNFVSKRMLRPLAHSGLSCASQLNLQYLISHGQGVDGNGNGYLSPQEIFARVASLCNVGFQLATVSQRMMQEFREFGGKQAVVLASKFGTSGKLLDRNGDGFVQGPEVDPWQQVMAGISLEHIRKIAAILLYVESRYPRPKSLSAEAFNANGLNFSEGGILSENSSVILP